MSFDQSDLPNIPGFRVAVETRERFAKSHLFDICNGIPVTDISRSKAEITPTDLQSKIISKTQVDEAEKENTNAAETVTLSKLPRWVEFDRKVLRFYAYFTEKVFNSAIENERVRKFIIYYYLADETIAIEEIKTENAGIPQSTFLKRQRVPSTDGESWLTHRDILVASTVNIYGRTFHVVDADKATRDYYGNELNITLSAATDFPKDDYMKYFEQREQYKLAAASSQSNDVKSFVEAIAGRMSSERLAASKKYLANDGKVLRFNGVWRDSSLGGTMRRYVILYFLADDSFQILEYDQNDSNKPESEQRLVALLKRDRLPKKYVAAGCTIGVRPDNYYNHGELRIGAYLNVYGRQVLLTSCDKFTQQFYVQVHGLKDPEDFAAIDICAKSKADKERNTAERPIPPYTGYGTEEDSLGSWKSLVPKPPRKDHHKLTKYDGCCLRFLAKLNEQATQSENYERRFVIEFFLTDDTIKIFEKPLRNSGFLSGKFLERTKVRNHERANSPWFHAEDFYVGATVTVNGFKFDLLETDKSTTDIMNNNTEVFTRQSPEQILKALADKLWDRSVDQTKTFRFVDEDKDRYISPDELKALCSKYGWNLNPKQLDVLFKYFDTDRSGEIEISEFFNALSLYKLKPHLYPK